MCFGGRDKEDEAGAARSRELDKIIRQDEKRMSKEVKLLLLGKEFFLLRPPLFRVAGLTLRCQFEQEPANLESRRFSNR